MRAGKRETENGKRTRSRKPSRPDSAEDARQRALKLLTIRSRGRAELVRSLEEKGFTGEAALGAARRLEREGWLDDAAAARALVRCRAGRYGRVRIAGELAARGFSRETAAAALSELDGGAEEKALSLVFARLQKASARLAPEKRRRRIWNALARRGFAGPAISAKMKREGQDPSRRPGDARDHDDVG